MCLRVVKRRLMERRPEHSRYMHGIWRKLVSVKVVYLSNKNSAFISHSTLIILTWPKLGILHKMPTNFVYSMILPGPNLLQMDNIGFIIDKYYSLSDIILHQLRTNIWCWVSIKWIISKITNISIAIAMKYAKFSHSIEKYAPKSRPMRKFCSGMHKAGTLDLGLKTLS
jgi:hypothetical protein